MTESARLEAFSLVGDVGCVNYIKPGVNSSSSCLFLFKIPFTLDFYAKLSMRDLQ